MSYTTNAEIGLWVDLLKEGQDRAHVNLSETEESYAALMLQRFTTKTNLTTITFALAYMEHVHDNQVRRQDSLWETADAGLLMAGLFPTCARKRNVPISYFTGMSQVCFFELAEICDRLKHSDEAGVYREVGIGVERVAYMLYCMRRRSTTMQEVLAQHGINLH
jgi:hypothetical protein